MNDINAFGQIKEEIEDYSKGFMYGQPVDKMIDPTWVKSYEDQERAGSSISNLDDEGNVQIKESASVDLINRRQHLDETVQDMCNSEYVFSTEPIVDYKSRNLSFVYMSQVLEELGVENNTFMLYLYDKGLQGVDPFADNLPQEVKDRILVECLRNPMYVLREITRVAVQGGFKPFELHLGNLSMAYLVLNNVNFYLEQPRQTYKTGSLMIIYAMIYNFGGRNGGMMLTHHIKNDAMNNLSKVLDTIELYPSYLNFLTEYDASGKAKKKSNKREYHIHPVTNSKIDAIASARDPKEAYNKGRGKTLNICNYDEGGFIPYVYIFYAAATPAFGTAKENAKANNLNYGIHITSTPPDTKTPEGEWMKNFVDQAVDFTTKIFDMTRDDLHEYINSNSENGFMFCSFSWSDLGLSQEWLEDKRMSLSGDMVTFRRDYLLEWIVDLSNSPFDEDDLREIKFHIGEGKFEELLINKKWMCKFYVPLHTFRVKYSVPKSLVIGLDFAAGYGRDACSIVAVDAKTAEVVMTFRSNKINPEEFSDLVIFLAKNYFQEGLLIPERNAYGEGLVSKIRTKHRELLRNLYFQYVSDNTKRDNLAKDTNFRYGIWNSGKVREELFSGLQHRVSKYKKRFKSLELYDEIIELIIKPNGKIDHKPGKHDDLVMAYNWCIFALTNPKCRIDRCGYELLSEDYLEQLEQNNFMPGAAKEKTMPYFSQENLQATEDPLEKRRIQFMLDLEKEQERRATGVGDFDNVGIYDDLSDDDFYDDEDGFY